MPKEKSFGLHGAQPSTDGRGEDAAVVGQETLRIPPDLSRFVDGAHDIGRPGGDKGPGGHTQPRVVVDDVEHLVDPAFGRFDVGDVGLPALVGEVSLEADPRALGSLVRLGDDEATGDRAPGRWSRPLGTWRPGVDMWKWIVSAPASKPGLGQLLFLTRTISSS